MKLLSKMLTALGAISIVTANAFAAPIPVAEYTFNNTFASSIGGGPSLVAVDPLNLSGFRTDTVFGTSRTVYDFKGGTANSSQAGLSLDVSSLLPDANLYSIQMQFMFTERVGGWRRILDVQNRQSDNGFYVNTGNHLAVFPSAGGAAFSNGTYHDVVLSNNNGAVTFYLDGGAQANVDTSVMDISADHLLNFFLDNIISSGQGEYSSGSIALLRVFDTALTGGDVQNLPGTSVPEPATIALLGLGLLGFGAARRRKQA